MNQSNFCHSLHQELVSLGASCGTTDSIAKLSSDRMKTWCWKSSKVGWTPSKTTDGFHDNRTEASNDNTCATAQDSWPRTSETATLPLWFSHSNIWKEKIGWIHEASPSNTGKKSRCGIIGLSKLCRLKKCCLSGRIVSITKELLLPLEWMISQGHIKAEVTLIYRAGFTSSQGSCHRPRQAMDRATLHTWKTCKR